MSYSILPVSRYRLKDLLCKLYHQNIYLSIYKLTFLERKGDIRISHRTHHFIEAKLLRFQRTFHELTFLIRKVSKRISHRTHHFIEAKLLRFQRTFHELTFLIRKVSKRISHRTHHFIEAKLLKFQETFPEKFLWSGFGADSPNL